MTELSALPLLERIGEGKQVKSVRCEVAKKLWLVPLEMSIWEANRDVQRSEKLCYQGKRLQSCLLVFA